MNIVFSLWVWIPTLVISLGWTFLRSHLPMDHFNSAWQEFLRVFSYLTAITFVLVTIIGFFSQYVIIAVN